MLSGTRDCEDELLFELMMILSSGMNRSFSKDEWTTLGLKFWAVLENWEDFLYFSDIPPCSLLVLMEIDVFSFLWIADPLADRG